MAARSEKFSRYDSADYLKSAEDMAAYLEAAFEEGGDNPAYIANAIGTVARAHGMGLLAKNTGLTREGLYKAFSREGNPRLGTVLKVLREFGLELTPRPAERREAQAAARKARRSRAVAV